MTMSCLAVSESGTFFFVVYITTEQDLLPLNLFMWHKLLNDTFGSLGYGEIMCLPVRYINMIGYSLYVNRTFSYLFCLRIRDYYSNNVVDLLRHN